MERTPSSPSVKRKRRSPLPVEESDLRSTRMKKEDGEATVFNRDDSPHTSVAGDLRQLRLHDVRIRQDNPGGENDIIPLSMQTSSPTIPPNLAELSQVSTSGVSAPLKIRGCSRTPEAATRRCYEQSTSNIKSVHPPLSDPTLWWSETELTGQHVDLKDPDDDGEGINGIGFIPTAAIADARAEKRRRQVKEWKERENREARARRGERRRLKDAEFVSSRVSRTPSLESAKKVRFMEHLTLAPTLCHAK